MDESEPAAEFSWVPEGRQKISGGVDLPRGLRDVTEGHLREVTDAKTYSRDAAWVAFSLCANRVRPRGKSTPQDIFWRPSKCLPAPSWQSSLSVAREGQAFSPRRQAASDHPADIARRAANQIFSQDKRSFRVVYPGLAEFGRRHFLVAR